MMPDLQDWSSRSISHRVALRILHQCSCSVIRSWWMSVHVSDSSLNDREWKEISRSLGSLCESVGLMWSFNLLFQAEFRVDRWSQMGFTRSGKTLLSSGSSDTCFHSSPWMLGIISQLDVVRATQPKTSGESRFGHRKSRKIPDAS